MCCFIIFFFRSFCRLSKTKSSHIHSAKNRTKQNKQHALNSNKYSLINDAKSQKEMMLTVHMKITHNTDCILQTMDEAVANQLHHGNMFSLEVLFSCHQHIQTHIRDWNERRDTNMENFIKLYARVLCL